MRLEVMEFPADAGADRSPLVVAHGLFGAARNWRSLTQRMAGGRAAYAVDMRNHGNSPHDPVHDYPAMAHDLADLIERLGGRAAVLGHSMGGKAAMYLAQTRPDLIERLIVADIAPVAYAHSLTNHIAVMQAVDLARTARRADVEAAIAAEIPDPGVAGFLAQGVDFTGPAPRWTLNLAALDAHMNQIVGYPDEGGVYDGPVLVIRGALSDYVTPEGQDRIRALFPAARFVTLEGAGHWLHSEKPKEFVAAAAAFLSEKTS